MKKKTLSLVAGGSYRHFKHRLRHYATRGTAAAAGSARASVRVNKTSA